MNFLLASPSTDDLARLLKAWRFWLLGAIVGALLGGSVYHVAPPPYRARATISVDFHLELAWPQNSDREQFYYLEREARKLREIAFSDAVLHPVALQAGDVTVEQMRAGKLQLSQPGHGGWHFFADDIDPGTAAALAAAWGSAFADQVQQQVIASATSGLEPYITVSADQVDNLPVGRLFSLSTYLFVGALVVACVSALAVLFLHAPAAKE